jgi:hypothetical protein
MATFPADLATLEVTTACKYCGLNLLFYSELVRHELFCNRKVPQKPTFVDRLYHCVAGGLNKMLEVALPRLYKDDTCKESTSDKIEEQVKFTQELVSLKTELTCFMY